MNRKKRVVVPRIKGTKIEAAIAIDELLHVVGHTEFDHDTIGAEKKCPKCRLLKRARLVAVKLRETE